MSLQKLLESVTNTAERQRSAVQELRQQIDDIRSRISAQKIKMGQIISAPPDDKDLQERACQVVGALVAQARDELAFEFLVLSPSDFSIDRFIDQFSRLPIHAGRVDGDGILISGQAHNRLSPIHLEALLRPEALAKMFANEAARNLSSIGQLGIPEATRKSTLKRLAAELDELERIEEALCRASDEAGVRVDRRADANPKWLLAKDVGFNSDASAVEGAPAS